METMYEKILSQIISEKPLDRKSFLRSKKNAAASFGCAPPSNSALISAYEKLVGEKKLQREVHIEKLLQKRSIRTASGIACITVMTKQFRCPGRCVFCPQMPGMPKSYLPDEPAMMRAVMNKFDPFAQVTSRLKTLQNNGHPTDKIEIRIAGETWSAYPKRYQTWFVKRVFDGLNCEKSRSLFEAHKKNETAKNRCVGMSIETRPDWVTSEEVKRLRKLGVTLVELGVQHTDNAILEANHRDHPIESTISATKLLRDAGFKIIYHMMPNLYASNIEKDLEAHREIFSNVNLRPDQLKIYPNILLKNTLLYRWFMQGKFTPYTTEELIDLLLGIKKLVPEYCRIIRVIRDVPGTNIVAGNKVTNLRQLLYEHPQFACRCIRCREPKERVFSPHDAYLNVFEYEANDGREFFISFDSRDKKILYGYVRLRLPKKGLKTLLPELQDSALVRELHVYGTMVPLHTRNSHVQHQGLGIRLMHAAEKLAKENGYHRMAVISGVGVREYYRNKLGYELEGTYMVKQLMSRV